MLLGVDDTDSPSGGCTTHLLTELVGLAHEHRLDVLGEPRLVRLNPNVPWKTRGNAALSLRLGRGHGRSRIIGELHGRPVRAYSAGRAPTDRATSEFRDAAWDQSPLFKKVYEEEFGVFGGAPFAAMIGDYEFGKHPEDIELLERISQTAAGAHAPFLSAASPEFFNLESYATLDAPRDLSKVFDSTEYAKWKSFRQSEDSRYVGLTAPRMLLRLPYGKNTKTVDAFQYEEAVDGTDHEKYLWGNSAYALGTRLTNAFAMYGWCAAIRGVEGGGLVEGLPVHNFYTDEGDLAMKCPTEVQITDRREKEMADQGFIPLVHSKNNDFAAFFSVQSCQKAKVYDKDAANANARLSTQLPYIFAVSRFAHYLKAMMRDKLGSFMSRSDCERFLNQWIQHYVTPDDTASQTVKASHPLREARIDVAEVPGKPGVYRATAFLRPHFQLDELSVGLRLVADLPAPAQKA